MDIKLLALYLLTGHIISAIFILLVLIRQVRLFRYHVQADLVWFRRTLFLLAVSIFIGNLIPITVDMFTILDVVERTTDHVNPIGIAYGASNAVIFALSSLLIWIMYRMAAKVLLFTEKENDNS